LKKLLLFFVLCLAGLYTTAQDDTLRVEPAQQLPDTTPRIPPAASVPDPATVPAPARPKVKHTNQDPQPQQESVPVFTEQPVPDTTITKTDSIPGSVVPPAVYGRYVSVYIEEHPYFTSSAEPLNLPSKPFFPPSKDTLFYLLCVLLIFLGALRMGFPKYFQDLFTAFWRPAFRQAQTRDHLQEAGMTTLVFNIFFVLSLGLFACLVILYLKPGIEDPLFLYGSCTLGMLILYSGKYVIFKLTGWMFGRTEIVNTYMFIVFLINKVLSVLLIPFVLVLAFSDFHLQQVAFTVSLILVIILLLYRYMLTFTGLRNELKISGLHLALFVLGFEIIPVLLIYRGLVQLFERSL